MTLGNPDVTGQLLGNSVNAPRLLALRNGNGNASAAVGGMPQALTPRAEEPAEPKGKGQTKGKGQCEGEEQQAKRRRNLILFSISYIPCIRTMILYDAQKFHQIWYITVHIIYANGSMTCLGLLRCRKTHSKLRYGW